MADRARLDGMTPEVLEGLASWCDLFPGDSTVGDAFANLAALCRAVAGAERLKRTRLGDFMVKIVAGEVVIDLLSYRHGYARRVMELGKGPTLAAALAAADKEPCEQCNGIGLIGEQGFMVLCPNCQGSGRLSEELDELYGEPFNHPMESLDNNEPERERHG